MSPATAGRKYLIPTCPPSPLSLPPLLAVILGSLYPPHSARHSSTLLGLPTTFVLTFASIPPVSTASKVQRARLTASGRHGSQRLGAGGWL